MQITIVGGGSYQWTPELLGDLLGTASLHGAHVVLEDVDPAPLVKMEALGPPGSTRPWVSGCTFATTTDQRRALDGADFVIVTVSTGGFDSMAVDLDVPARFGIRQSVGDTVGPGGVNRSLRNVPVLLGMARDMAERVPRGLDAQHHQPDDVPDPGRVPGDPGAGGGPVPRSRQLDDGPGHRTRGGPAEAVRATVAGVNHLPVVDRSWTWPERTASPC